MITPEYIRSSVDYIMGHPHYKREDPNITSSQLQLIIERAWASGLLNIMVDVDTKEFVGMFEAHTIEGNNVWKVADRYPKLIGQVCRILFVDMAYIDPDKKLKIRDMYRILYKMAQITGAMKLHYTNRKKSYLYTLDKRKYKFNGKNKFFIFNKNIRFMV